MPAAGASTWALLKDTETPIPSVLGVWLTRTAVLPLHAKGMLALPVKHTAD